MARRHARATFTDCLSKDELNLAEFPLSIIGKRPPKGVKTLEFRDEIKHPDTKEIIRRQLTVTGSDLLGLPTSVDEEVLVGCLKLTRDDGMQRRRVPFTAYQFLKELGWAQDGRSYRRLTESLDRWKGVMVISNNAFWHRGQQKLVKDTFGLIDRWKLSGDADPASDKRGWFVWGDFLWESLQAGNLKTLDFGFWKSLKSPVARRLFRLLDKRFYDRATVTFPLRTLAHDKVGVSRRLHTGQIKETLQKGHEELEGRGFCHARVVRRGRGDWEVVYTDLRNGPSRTSGSDALYEALKERGIKNASELVKKHPAKRIEEAIENYDDRRAHGEDLSPGWLGKCITHKTGFVFRKGYVPLAEQKAKLLRVREQEQRAKSAKRQEDEAAKKAQAETAAEFAAFIKRLKKSKELKAFTATALEAMPMFKQLYEERLKQGDRRAAARLRHDAVRYHWQQTVRRAKKTPA